MLSLRGANLCRFLGEKNQLREYTGQSKCRIVKRQLDKDCPMGNEKHYRGKEGVFPSFCLRAMLLSMTPLRALNALRVVNGAPPQ